VIDSHGQLDIVSHDMSTRATTRAAEPNDLGTILLLLSEMQTELFDAKMAEKTRNITEHVVKSSLDNYNVVYYLAFVNDLPVGVGKVEILHNDPIFRLLRDPRCGYIDDMYVRLGFRKRGIAKSIIEALECWVMDQGVFSCILHSAPRALFFYSQRGYQHNREMHKRLSRKVKRNEISSEQQDVMPTEPNEV